MTRERVLRLAFAGGALFFFLCGWMAVRTYYSRYYAVAATQGFMSPQEHIRRVERSLAYDPYYGNANVLLADTLIKRGRAEEALEAQERGMRSYRTIRTNLQMAAMLERAGKTDEARSVYEEVLALAPSHVSALVRLAVIAYAAGENARVEELARQIAKVDLNNPNPLYLRALVAEKTGNLPEAYLLYQKISGAGEPSRNALYKLDEVRARLEALAPHVAKR